MDSDGWITSAETAKILGVDRSTLSRWDDDPDRRLTFTRDAFGYKHYRLDEVRARAEELAAGRAS